MDTEWTRAATDNEFGNLFLGEEMQEDALQTQMMRIGECEVEVEVMGRESGHVYDKTGHTFTVRLVQRVTRDDVLGRG